MFVLDNVPLSGYSTMRLGGPAKHLTEVDSKISLVEAVAWAQSKDLPIVMIGQGSNIIWGDNGFGGLVIVNKILGFDIFEEVSGSVYLTVGAGENWDDIVKKTVDKGWSGLEQLSLIPGTTGATPIQNVGAYGREVADLLTTLEAYDLETNKFVIITNNDCDFSYRKSRFNTSDRGKFLITSVTFHLTSDRPMPPFYSSVQDYLNEHKLEPTAKSVRKAVIDIRRSKLPDPKLVANCGSFFGNPIIDKDTAENLRINFQDIVMWELKDGKRKVSAAWLIENAGFKDYHDKETGMATWHKQPLVMVNEAAGSTANLLTFKKKITQAVKDKFDIDLVQEPELFVD